MNMNKKLFLLEKQYRLWTKRVLGFFFFFVILMSFNQSIALVKLDNQTAIFLAIGVLIFYHIVKLQHLRILRRLRKQQGFSSSEIEDEILEIYPAPLP